MKTLREEQEQRQKNSVDRQHSREQFNSFGEGVDLDELLELRQRLQQREEELQRLRMLVQQQENGSTKVGEERRRERRIF